MARRDNELRPVTYIRVSAVMPLIKKLKVHRDVMPSLLSRHDVSAAELSDPYAIIPLHRFVALLEDAALLLDDPFLGANFGGDFKAADIGPMGILFSLAPSIRASFDRISHYLNSLQNATTSVLVDEGERLVWSYRITDKTIWPRRQDAEYTLSATCHLARSCFSARWAPLEVHFEHDEPDNVERLRKLIRAPLLFRQSSNRIIFDAQKADKIYREEDKALTALIERQLGDLLDQAPREIDPVAQVKKLLELYIGRRPITLRFLAEEMGLSQRTLQRHLKAEGKSLTELTRLHREDLAARLLAAKKTKLADVALALGYTDGATFSRAFKLWNGTPPSKASRSLAKKT
ncbi:MULTISPECIES: AraC family transcriptional regulator [unclassified Rhizobium]|uniref:AraC family transcriptional regulator n=1 Tax=unclassified Rhizobium TaxID=2613769 RepID=UPI00177D9616|nr:MULTISPECIES: AraC family transcriptional regulator [unclassified Rhizobium]MBD8688539.1 AraC family transcriptional regulator [Rhizobium sp. CFBP 13644]MBD8692959.1 AraC family transcriptional regulator [Rhizobium sp. CFBP 13717]